MKSAGHIVCIAGKAGTGKSTYARKLVRGAKRLIVLDPKGEHRELGAVHKGLAASLQRVLKLQEGRVPRFREVFRLPVGEPMDELLRSLTAFREDWDDPEPDPSEIFTLLFDEADMQARPGERNTGADYLVQYGRVVCDPIIMLARRLSRLPRDATANARRIVLFETDEPADLEELRKRKGPEAVERMRAVKGHAYLEF